MTDPVWDRPWVRGHDWRSPLRETSVRTLGGPLGFTNGNLPSPCLSLPCFPGVSMSSMKYGPDSDHRVHSNNIISVKFSRVHEVLKWFLVTVPSVFPTSRVPLGVLDVKRVPSLT